MNAVVELEHAALAPSSAHQWVHCGGSVMLSAGMVLEETDQQREGTAAHWVAERILASYMPEMPIIVADDLIGQPAVNGVIVTEEMWDGASLYANEILVVCNTRGLLSQLHVEERVVMPEIHELCWGTPDCWAFDQAQRTLYLWDFKFGHSSEIAFENWQMICYILGVLKKVTNDQPLQDHGIKVVVRVVQPRCYDGLGPIREWKLDATDLRGYVTQLNMAAVVAVGFNPTCVTGAHCKNCDGRAHCPALRESAARVIDHSCDSIPSPMTEVGLAYELEKLTQAEERLKARRGALEVDAEHRIRSGTMIPGLSLEQGYGRDKWTMEDSMVLSTGQMMGVDLTAPATVITPSQAKALLKKNDVDPTVIAGLYAKPPTSMKLVVDDGSKAARIFSKGEL